MPFERTEPAVQPEHAATFANSMLQRLREMHEQARMAHTEPNQEAVSDLMRRFSLYKAVAVGAGKGDEILYDLLDETTQKKVGLYDAAQAAKEQAERKSAEAERLEAIKKKFPGVGAGTGTGGPSM